MAKKCPNCGALNAGKVDVCAVCGHRLDGTAQAGEGPAQQPDFVDRAVSKAILVEKPAEWLDRHSDD